MLTNETEINNSLDALISSIENSDIYQTYLAASEEVRKYPGLQERIDEYRMKNFELQQTYQGDELDEKLESFAKENIAFRTEPVVDRYLNAELAFVRLKQSIDIKMLDALDFH